MDESILHIANEKNANKWIIYQFYCNAMIVALICIVEIGVMFVMESQGLLFQTRPRFFLLYVLLPTGMNLIALLIVYIILKKVQSTVVKATSVSLLMTFISFVVYTVHLIFPSLDVGFALSIFTSIIYGSTRVTTITAVAAFALKIYSDVFTLWDGYPPDHRLYTKLDTINFLVSMVVLVIVYIAALLISRIEKNKHSIYIEYVRQCDKLTEETQKDALTGTYNRRGLRDTISNLLVPRTTDVLVMLDMDNFKEINDTYGHSIGDKYLESLGELLLQTNTCQAFRYGGDEFCLLFQNVTAEYVQSVCREIQESFLNTEPCRTSRPVTLSFGASFFRENDTSESWLSRSDMALYEAKKNKGAILFYENLPDQPE